MDEKLTRVNGRLYTETRQGTTFKYKKLPERLYLTLNELSVVHFATLEGPWSDFILNTDDDDILSEEKPKWLTDDLAEKIKSSEQVAIKAIGVISDRRLILIDDNGGTHPQYSRRVDVLLRGVETIHEYYRGSLVPVSEDMRLYDKTRSSNFALELPCPKSALDPIIRDLEGGRLPTVTLSVYVDVFQDEVERGLSEPWMTQDYYIEETGWAMAFLGSLTCESGATPPLATKSDRNFMEEDEETAGDEDSSEKALPVSSPNPSLQSLSRELRQLKWIAAAFLLVWLFSGLK